MMAGMEGVENMAGMEVMTGMEVTGGMEVKAMTGMEIVTGINGIKNKIGNEEHCHNTGSRRNNPDLTREILKKGGRKTG